MDISSWIALAGLIVLWASSLVIFFVKIKIKLNELEIMICNNHNQFKDHQTWGDRESLRLEKRIDNLLEENKIEHKEILFKMDNMLVVLNKFKLEIIEKIAGK